MDNHGLNTYNRGDQWIKACGFNEADIIRRLLDEGADVEQEPSNPLYRGKFSPLLQACRHGRLDTARLLFVRERVESQDVCRGESRALADSSAVFMLPDVRERCLPRWTAAVEASVYSPLPRRPCVASPPTLCVSNTP